MSEEIVTIEDAAYRLAELVDEVYASREAAVLTKAGRSVAFADLARRRQVIGD